MTDPLTAAFVGLGAGLLSGAFGVGGGVVTTPAIRLLLGYPELIAVGTPLPVILPTAVAGAITHARKGSARLRTGLLLGLWGAPASILGAVVTRAIGGSAVLVITAVVVLLAAIDIIRPQRHFPRGGSGGADATGSTAGGEVPAARVAALGLATGFYSGLLGLGGGFVLVPLLRRVAGFDVKTAIGTSLVTVAVLAVPGSITHWLLGNVDVPLALALSVGVIPGAIIGARFTVAAGERVVRFAFAALLVLTGVLLAAGELGLL